MTPDGPATERASQPVEERRLPADLPKPVRFPERYLRRARLVPPHVTVAARVRRMAFGGLSQ